jgi:hypothetical protein
MGRRRADTPGRRNGGQFAGFAHKCRPATSSADVAHERLVERERRRIAGKHEGVEAGADHLKWAVAERGAAHAFGVEPRGFFEDERTGADRGERIATSGEKEVPEIAELGGELRDVRAPIGEIRFDCGRRLGELRENDAGVVPAQRAAEPFEGHEGREVGFAGDGKLRAGAERHDEVGAVASGESGVLVTPMTKGRDGWSPMRLSNWTVSALRPD